MKAIKRFLMMYGTAGILLCLGLDIKAVPPREMIMITGAVCGAVNMIWSWLED